MADKELLAWAYNILQRESDAGLYGAITFRLESGRITIAKTEKSEKPDNIKQEKTYE